MKENTNAGLLPDQYTGEEINSEKTELFENTIEAKAFYNKVVHRLQNVNEWHQLAGTLSADFQLTDKNGHDVMDAVQKGNFIRINIRGPGNKSGEGYDWVQVEELKYISGEDEESFGFRVRPARNPAGDEDVISHFYSEESTSSFIVSRMSNKITAGIYDRNTLPNSDAVFFADKIRHLAVGTVGIAALSKLQWNGLLEGLMFDV
ncbi:MAG TPA: hypothetical protein VIQ00_06720 [Chitinophagaceae bacterium]